MVVPQQQHPTGCLKSQQPYPPDSPQNPFPFASCRDVVKIISSSGPHHPALDPHVHFPPSPTISSTYITHSPATYDRAPIVVSQNTCELPERGRRVYTSSRLADAAVDAAAAGMSNPAQRAPAYAGHRHSRALGMMQSLPNVNVAATRSPLDCDPGFSPGSHDVSDSSSPGSKRRRCISWQNPGGDRHWDSTKPSAFKPPSLDDGCLGGF